MIRAARNNSNKALVNASNVMLVFGIPPAGASYRFLVDHYIGGLYFDAGEIASDTSLGGPLPIGWIPTQDVEPLNTPAVIAFYNNGPILPDLIRQRLTNEPVNKPVTYWSYVGNNLWGLTGLGAHYPPLPMA